MEGLVGRTIAEVMEPARHDDAFLIRFVDGGWVKFYSSAYEDSSVDWIESSLEEVRAYQREAMGSRERRRMFRLFADWKATYPAAWFEYNERERARMSPTARMLDDMRAQMIMEMRSDIQRSMDWFGRSA